MGGGGGEGIEEVVRSWERKIHVYKNADEIGEALITGCVAGDGLGFRG